MSEETPVKTEPEITPVSKADELFRELHPRENVQVDDLFETVAKALEGARSGQVMNRDAVRRVFALLKQAESGGPDDPSVSVESALMAAVRKDAEGHTIGRTTPTAKVEDIAKRWKPSGQVGR